MRPPLKETDIKKQIIFSVLVLSVFIAQIDSSSMAIAGELFFKGKITGENNKPLPNIKITVNGSEQATTDQSGDFSFPVESLVWGVREDYRPTYSVIINERNSPDTNVRYLSHYLIFHLLWGSEDKSNPNEKIKITESKGTEKFEVDEDGITTLIYVGSQSGAKMLADRLTIRLGERSDVRTLKNYTKRKTTKNSLKKVVLS